LWTALCLGLVGCSSSSPGHNVESHPSSATGDDAGLPDDDDDDEGDDDEGDDNDGDEGDGDESGDGDFEECAASRVEAERELRPLDIVWVIDSSGSMEDEAATVQANMNDFAAQIAGAGIDDYRVVVITRKGWVKVPNPLGSDSTHFLFVDEDVQSNEPLIDLVDRFDSYGSFLQPNAITHFVVVTDDESAMSASEFLAKMKEKLGKDDFFVHAIASEDTTHQSCLFPGFLCVDMPGCGNANNFASAPGKEHYAAAMATGGLTFSICTDDWKSLFNKLAEKVSVSAPIPCELLVPESNDGKALDPNLVNVVFTPEGESMGAPIPRVDAAASCGMSSAWYYDNPEAPSKIVLCPTTCTTVEGGGAIDIALGCATVIVQ
jgi:hypothetical protein